MMNLARVQMKTWITVKNEHKARVQDRWDNRAKTNKAFQTWRRRVGHEYETIMGTKHEEGKERERTYGINHWGRIRSIPRIHTQVKNFLQKGIG
eukprot:6175783-Pleurochrysis_carterae.AAC.4